MVFCEGTPVGVLLGENKGNGILDIQLDYTIPSYRDCSVGQYIYSKLSSFGIHEMIYTIKLSQKHKKYLEKMGFVQNGEIYLKNWKNSKDMWFKKNWLTIETMITFLYKKQTFLATDG